LDIFDVELRDYMGGIAWLVGCRELTGWVRARRVERVNVAECGGARASHYDGDYFNKGVGAV
jgi:hypothetical protein